MVGLYKQVVKFFKVMEQRTLIVEFQDTMTLLQIVTQSIVYDGGSSTNIQQSGTSDSSFTII